MPGTLWSAPVPALNVNSVVVSPATGTPTDISPAQIFILPGQMNVGTRMRIRAYGSYLSTTTASSLTLAFYATSVSGAGASPNVLVATSAVIAATASTAVVNTSSVAFPWMLEWEGQFRTISSPIIGATNATIMGQGKAYLPATLTTYTITAIPQTAALRTVTQTGTPGFGLVTNLPQIISVGATVAVNTGFTSITTDELTVELLG
jgi:hypothetical protein